VATAEHQWLKSQQTNNVHLVAPVLVTVLGHTAIATGLLIAEGKDAARSRPKKRMRFTDAWVRVADGCTAP